MRKLSILLAFVLVSLVSTATFAQDAKVQAQEVAQEKIEVQISELPEAVTKTLGEQFAEYSANKAYKAMQGDKEVYYVKLVKGEEYTKVLIDAEGNVIESKKEIKKLK